MTITPGAEILAGDVLALVPAPPANPPGWGLDASDNLYANKFYTSVNGAWRTRTPIGANIIDFGADSTGATDSTAAFTAAYTAGGGSVYVPPGTFLVGPLTLTSGAYLNLAGTLKLRATANGSLLTLTGSNITVEGSGTLNGNASAQSSTPASGGIITTSGSSSIFINGVSITNCLNWPLNIVGTNYARVTNVSCTSSGNSAEFAAESTNCWAIGLTVAYIADEGFAFYGGVTNSGIIGSTLEGNSAAGISVLNDSAQPTACANIIIEGNICFSNGAQGISIDNGTGASGYHSGILIQGNRCYSNNTDNYAGSGQDIQVGLGNASGTVSKNNFFGAGALITGPQYTNPVDYGADPTGVKDSTEAFLAAYFSSLTSYGAAVQFPPGTFYIASTITITVAAGTSVSVLGAGSQATILKFAGGVNGFVFNYASATSSARVQGLTVSTESAGGANGLTFNQVGAFGIGPVSSITDVTLRGSDGFAGTYYWSSAIVIDSASNFNLTSVYMVGPAPGGSGYLTSTSCYGLYILGTSSVPPVVFNLQGCNMNYLGVGLYYGPYTQGVSLTQCNMVGCYEGIQGTGASLVELVISLSQFNVGAVAINVTNVADVLLSGNEFFIPNNAIGVQITQSQRFSLTGNSFVSIGSTNNGIVIISYSGGAGLIVGNTTLNLGTAIWLQSGSEYVNVQSNGYSGNTTNILNQGTNNTIGGGSP